MKVVNGQFVLPVMVTVLADYHAQLLNVFECGWVGMMYKQVSRMVLLGLQIWNHSVPTELQLFSHKLNKIVSPQLHYFHKGILFSSFKITTPAFSINCSEKQIRYPTEIIPPQLI
jgi:hypothetical protein